jgi:hypothetical protein
VGSERGWHGATLTEDSHTARFISEARPAHATACCHRLWQLE